MDSEKNQRIKSKFVDREVIYCVSTLVYELAQKSHLFDEYFDDLTMAFEGIPDYEEAANNDGWYKHPVENYFYKECENQYYAQIDSEYVTIWHMKKPEICDSVVEGYSVQEIEEAGFDPEDVYSIEEFIDEKGILPAGYELVDEPECNFEINETASSMEELCEEEGIYVDYPDVFEHWIVSDWLANRLEKHGEKVLRDFFGMTVWCRCTTGQAILLDSVISEICFELEILCGQKYEWEV